MVPCGHLTTIVSDRIGDRYLTDGWYRIES